MEEKSKVKTPCIIVHGGAWTIPHGDFEEQYRNGLLAAVKDGYEVLKNGGSAVQAVEKAVNCMENNPNFNAGHGSVLNENGEVECDAMIMDGHKMATGAVMAINYVANPVSLAKRVMEETRHCALNAEGALSFAKKIGYPVLNDPKELLTEQAIMKGNKFNNYDNAVHGHIEGKRIGDTSHDTVGAVAMDMNGHIACATSTGGIPAKMAGRIGDSPLVGCGGYANEYGGSSTTGHGESLMKMTLAREAIYNLEQGHNAQVAAEKAITRMRNRIDGYGGVIVIDNEGNIGKAFSTIRMGWASIKEEKLSYGLDPKECNIVNIE